MKITDALLGEHGLFYAQFDHLEQIVPTITDLDLVVAEAKFLAAGLETHAHLEEELLFVALDSHLDSGMGPWAVMRMEHDEIEQELARLRKADDLGDAQRLMLHIVQVARGHFAKEEEVLYPMAVQVLGEETLTKLGALWAQQRNVIVA